MPYIEQWRRDNLAYLPFEAAGAARNVGELTYLFYLAANRYGDNPAYTESYARHAEVIAALENAKEEYRRQVLDPYEDAKRKENGDV